MSYEIRVCPVCHEQVEWDYEQGYRCYHDEYGEAEAVKVAVDPVGLEAALALGLFRLQEDGREKAFQLAERRWFASLPEAERERLTAERRSKMSPLALALEDSLFTEPSLLRQIYG